MPVCSWEYPQNEGGREDPWGRDVSLREGRLKGGKENNRTEKVRWDGKWGAAQRREYGEE